MPSTCTSTKGRAIKTLASSEASRAVRELEGITLHQDRFLFLVLCLSRQDGYAYMKQKTMARELRCSTSMVEKLVHWAKGRGYLTIVREREQNLYYPRLENFPYLISCGFQPAPRVDSNPYDVRVHPYDPDLDLSLDPKQQQAEVIDDRTAPIDETLTKELAAATNQLDDEKQEVSEARQATSIGDTPAASPHDAESSPTPDGSLEVSSAPIAQQGGQTLAPRSQAPRKTEPSKLLSPELEAAVYAIPNGAGALRVLAQAKSPGHAQRAAERLLEVHQRVGVPNPGGFMRTILPDFEHEAIPQACASTGGGTMYRIWTSDQAPPVVGHDPTAAKIKPALRKGSVDFYLRLRAKLDAEESSILSAS
jgi:hypothetical protein